MDVFTAPDGRTLYADPTEGRRGMDGPFVVVYTDEAGDEQWGFRCENCESADVAADSMGRIQCNDCGNRTKAEVWDAAHE